MIIALIDSGVNVVNDYFCEIPGVYLSPFASLDRSIRASRRYCFAFDFRDYELRVPVINPACGCVSRPLVLWPSEKLPRRRYPASAYLFAVSLYLSSQLSMREVAERTRQKFGLEKFSHSTLARALKKLLQNANSIWEASVPFLVDPHPPLLVIRKRWTSSMISMAGKLLEALHPVLEDLKEGAHIAYRFFCQSGGSFIL